MQITRVCYFCGSVALKVSCEAYAPGSAVVNRVVCRCPNKKCREMLTFHTGQKDTDADKSRAEYEKQEKQQKPLPSGGQSMKFYVLMEQPR